ncbi:MAG: adenylate/guanylate cyclase domain-containing protein, partial [Chloroflexota bacterium]
MIADTPIEPENDEKILAAINEVVARRGLLSRGTYTQVMLALYNRLRENRTRRETPTRPLSPLRDELRLATVMFVDVVGSTNLAQELGNELWRLLIAEGHRRLAATVQLWEGEIGQYMGDGMLCYFGARKSRGNDTNRAVSCALAMLDRMSDYSLFVAEEYGVKNFAVRIGMATGQVVVGTFGTDT